MVRDRLLVKRDIAEACVTTNNDLVFVLEQTIGFESDFRRISSAWLRDGTLPTDEEIEEINRGLKIFEVGINAVDPEVVSDLRPKIERIQSRAEEAVEGGLTERLKTRFASASSNARFKFQDEIPQLHTALSIEIMKCLVPGLIEDDEQLKALIALGRLGKTI